MPARDLQSAYERLYDAQTTILSCIAFEFPKSASFGDKADKYCGNTNIDPDDAIHLAMAVESGCNILVTRDKDFRAIADDIILAILPEEIDIALSKLPPKLSRSISLGANMTFRTKG